MFKLFERGFKMLSMREAASEIKTHPNIKVIDVRTPEEHRQGHIPGSLLVPLDQWEKIEMVVPDKSTPLFVYCLSGARSQAACRGFAKLGYTDVTNIGGIADYQGPLER